MTDQDKVKEALAFFAQAACTEQEREQAETLRAYIEGLEADKALWQANAQQHMTQALINGQAAQAAEARARELSEVVKYLRSVLPAEARADDARRMADAVIRGEEAHGR